LASVFALLGIAWPLRAAAPPLSSVIHPDWTSQAVIYEVNVRQYTPEGTFRAFAEHVPRLQEMGVNILWLMPIHPIGELKRKGSLGSYYSVRDFRGINPEFGAAADLRDLITRAHNAGMKVILDWVGNHCAWDNALVTEHPNWFTRDSTGKMQPPVPDWHDVVDLNYDVPALRDYMIESLQYWVREYDVDGFRCDVSGMMPAEFWARARRELNALKPVFMLAEDENPACHTAAFDMTYSWSLHHLLRDIAQGKKSIHALDTLLADEKLHYPPTAIRMRFTDNHDENSWNKSVFERMQHAVIPFAVLTATLPGLPLVYTGQEAGLDRSLNFFEKDSVSWTTLPYAELYTKLLHLKRTHPALASSDLTAELHRLRSNVDAQLYAYERIQNGRRVIVLLNLSDKPLATDITYSDAPGTFLFDLMNNHRLELAGEIKVSLAPWAFQVLFD
jgi:glycosidase